MFDKIRKIIEEDPDNVTILEEVIDVELQMDYFKYSVDVKKNLDIDEVEKHKDDLFSKDVSLDKKKSLLVELASINNVDLFRIVEKYMKNPDSELRDWSILAYQESRMLIQSSLMEKTPVFISTGLGGKKDKLRYSVVFFSSDNEPFTELQKNIIKGEIEYLCNKTNSELEGIEYNKNYCSLLIMIPLKVSIKDSLLSLVNSCNELGGFINSSFLVTNVKHLNDKDIMEAYNKKGNKN